MDSYIVYKHTTPCGKVYIGMSKQIPRKRFDYGAGYNHNPRFRAAIKEYGWGNIQHEIIASNLSAEEAGSMEARLIESYHSTDPDYGYNVKSGGLHGAGMSAEARAQLVKRMTGENNPTIRCGHPFQGKKHSEESKKKMSEAAKRRIDRVCSEATKAKLKEKNPQKKPVRCVNTGAVYESIHEAARQTNLTPSSICAVCRGKKLHTTGGFLWEYVKGDEP